MLDWSASLPLKRRRFTNIHPMEAEKVTMAKLAAAKGKFGREISVFETSSPSYSQYKESNAEEIDDFYEFTAEDYYRLLATKKEDKFLKTRKIREAEEKARRSTITKATIRVRFPDNHTLEAMFHPSETIQSLVDLLQKVITRPDLPFDIYTTPPKKQIKDLSQDFYTAGFAPGAILYFAYDIPKGDDSEEVKSGPFLQEEIMSLKSLEFIVEHQGPVQSVPEPVTTQAPTPVEERKPTENKSAKPKWLKL